MKKLVLFILLNVLIISCSEKNVAFKCKTDSDIFKHGYYNIIVKRKELDKSTFMCLDGGYAKDRNNVYVFSDYKIEEANPKTFEVLSLMYAKDNNSVYYLGKKINDSDPNTFILLEDGKAKDKNNNYLNGEIVEKK